jgi:hypothetical protein
MGDGRDVPRVTGHGTCKEGGGVVNEVGDYHLHELLWEPSDWRRVCGMRVRGASTEQPLDFGLASIPEPLSEQFGS